MKLGSIYIYIYIYTYDPETKEQSKEWKQCFPMLKEVQDTEVIKQGAGTCLLRQRWNFACRLSGKGCNHHGKQQLVSKCQGKLLKGILRLRDNAVPHNAAITHQKLADLCF
jgi:hypothetical protein